MEILLHYTRCICLKNIKQNLFLFKINNLLKRCINQEFRYIINEMNNNLMIYLLNLIKEDKFRCMKHNQKTMPNKVSFFFI